MKKLRIGLLTDSFDIPAWKYGMLERIMQSDYGKIVLVVLIDSCSEKSNGFSKINNNWRKLAYIAYCKLEDRFFNPVPDALKVTDLKKILSEIPILTVKPEPSKSSDWIKFEDIEKIKNYELDVLIQLGSMTLRGQILTTARFGIWSYQHGEKPVNEGGPFDFWEDFKNQSPACTSLQILNQDLDSIKVLYKSYSSMNDFSIKNSCNKCYWKSLSFIPRKLEELYNVGEKKFFKNVECQNKYINSLPNRLYEYPANSEVLKLFTKRALRYAKKMLDRQFFFEQWILLFKLKNGISDSLESYKKLIPPKDRIWADPHIIYKSEKYYIFIEELLFEHKKGHISLIIMDKNGRYEKPVKVIDRPYHLSYPFVFEWKDEYYMVPESSQNKTIELYKCIQFPDKWEFQHNLLKNIRAFDSTLFYHHQMWWLFANVVENEGASSWDELFLFYANSPISDKWIAHPQNPIVSDVRKSRPAGKIFRQNGTIYRPSQNSSKSYGYGLKFNQILKLNETEFEEIEVNSIEPDWDKNIKAVHSFNDEKNLIIIDGKLKRSKCF